jgi:hypothetical protein
MFLSGVGMSNIAVQRTVNDHTHTWYRVRAMQENGLGGHQVLVCQHPHVIIYVLLHPSRTCGSSKDGQGYHHLPPTPRSWKGHAITHPIYPGTSPVYIVTTQVPCVPDPTDRQVKNLGIPEGMMNHHLYLALNPNRHII